MTVGASSQISPLIWDQRFLQSSHWSASTMIAVMSPTIAVGRRPQSKHAISGLTIVWSLTALT